MKVLVATKETQGERANDFCYLPEGALVGFTHAHAGEPVDAACGCQRGLGGLTIDRSATTFKVVEREIEKEDYTRQVVAANSDFIGDGASAATFKAEAEELLRIAAHFPTGAIIERRGQVFRMRGPAGLRRVPDCKVRARGREAA